MSDTAVGAAEVVLKACEVLCDPFSNDEVNDDDDDDELANPERRSPGLFSLDTAA